MLRGFSHGLKNSPPDYFLHQCAHDLSVSEQRMRDSFAFLPVGKNRGSSGRYAARQQSPGLLDFIFESLVRRQKIKAIQKDGFYFLAEDEGFEPPQTESESGVLPLHKSSMHQFSADLDYYTRKAVNVKPFYKNIYFSSQGKGFPFSTDSRRYRKVFSSPSSRSMVRIYSSSRWVFGFISRRSRLPCKYFSGDAGV